MERCDSLGEVKDRVAVNHSLGQLVGQELASHDADSVVAVEGESPKLSARVAPVYGGDSFGCWLEADC